MYEGGLSKVNMRLRNWSSNLKGASKMKKKN